MLSKLLKSVLPFRESARKGSRFACNHVRRETPAARLCSFERLEERTLLSVVPLTNQEQLLLELINRAREDPAAEAALYGIGLNDGLTPGTISSAAKPPLSANILLRNAARNHSQDMIDRDFFLHDNPDGQSAWDRVTASGYFLTAAGAWGMGENIARLVGTHNAALRTHDMLFKSPPHRENILGESFVDTGVGIKYGDFTGYGQSTLVTEVFGFRNAQRYITGVAFTDAVAANNFYDAGEGLGGITIQALSSGGALYTTTTASAGGYQVAVPNGTYTVTATGAGIGTVSFGNISVQGKNVKVDFTPGGLPTLVTNVAGTGDFDGDGADDVLLRNSTTGLIGAWILNNGAYQRYSSIGIADPAVWDVVGVGRLDGDWTDDVLLRNSATGLIGAWIINNGGYQSWASIGKVDPAAWDVAGVGYFNADIFHDILLRNSVNGLIGVWMINNAAYQSWSSIGVVDPTVWDVAGVGDFDGDLLSDDVLLRNSATGLIGTWITQNGAYQSWSSIGVADPTTWDVAGTGDLNPAFLAWVDDVLLRNPTTGLIGAWIVNNGAYQSWSSIGVADPTAWDVAGVGDFNGDGTDDLLLCNFVSGLIGTWTINNGAYQSWSSIGVVK